MTVTKETYHKGCQAKQMHWKNLTKNLISFCFHKSIIRIPSPKPCLKINTISTLFLHKFDFMSLNHPHFLDKIKVSIWTFIPPQLPLGYQPEIGFPYSIPVQVWLVKIDENLFGHEIESVHPRRHQVLPINSVNFVVINLSRVQDSGEGVMLTQPLHYPTPGCKLCSPWIILFEAICNLRHFLIG